MTSDQELSLAQFINLIMSDGNNPNDEIYSYLCRPNIGRLKTLLRRLEAVQNAKYSKKHMKGKQSRLIGRIFECFVKELTRGCLVFRVEANVRSTTSEIDFRIGLEPMSRALPMLRDCGVHVIGEAKLVGNTIKSEWINEFAGILPNHGARLGFLFTYIKGRKLRSEHRMAIALHAVQGKVVVPVGRTQIDKVLSGQNFLRLLADQHSQALCHQNSIEI